METANQESTSGSAVPPPSAPPHHAIFFGPHGLRAGWRLAIYALLYFAFVFVILPLVTPVFGLNRLPPLWGFFVYECLLAMAAILPAIFMSRIESRPFGDYGLPLQSAFGKNFWAGALWGFVAFTVLILVMRGVGLVSFDGVALHGVRVVKFAAFWAVMFVVVGFREDFLFRGYSLFTLGDGIGFWPAAIALCIAFGGIHLANKGEAWVGILGASTIGLFFCLTLRRTGSLWFAIGMHMTWDWSETYFYSVPDSGLVLPGHLLNTTFHGPRWLTGGSVGPEGSVLLFILIAALWLVFDRVYPAKNVAPQNYQHQEKTA
jgi:uncharacterized protein